MELMEINEELKASSHTIPDSKIDEFIAQAQSHPRIFVYGTGRSGLMLKALAMRFMQIGLTAFVVGETTTPSVGSGDLLIVASSSGETASVVSAVKSGMKSGASVLAITGMGESSLTREVEPLIRIESGSKFSTSSASVQPLGSLFEQMLLLIFDAVILRMSRQGGDKNQAMAKRHASIE
ncbi:6-phospho-3-hexuloisomerase [Anaerovibrio sp.]|uniref:6-phospho-3-hexuloisomerase n=1 Tax=Anaerovibrio sp. TaxID=1872532 RepID=UPI003F13947D